MGRTTVAYTRFQLRLMLVTKVRMNARCVHGTDRQAIVFHFTVMMSTRRMCDNLINGGRWLVFAPLTPIGFGLARRLRRWPVTF